jgi:hypothetical protein
VWLRPRSLSELSSLVQQYGGAAHLLSGNTGWLVPAQLLIGGMGVAWLVCWLNCCLVVRVGGYLSFRIHTMGLAARDGSQFPLWFWSWSCNRMAPVITSSRLCPWRIPAGAGVYKELWPHAAPAVITTHEVAEMTSITHHHHGLLLGGAVTLQQLLHQLKAPASSSGRSSSSGVSGGAPASTAKAWCAMADHLERIAGGSTL